MKKRSFDRLISLICIFTMMSVMILGMMSIGVSTVLAESSTDNTTLHEVKLHANGGTGAGVAYYVVDGDTLGLPELSSFFIAPEGKSPYKWYDEKNKVWYSPGEQISVNGDMDLYAGWSKPVPIVLEDAEGRVIEQETESAGSALEIVAIDNSGNISPSYYIYKAISSDGFMFDHWSFTFPGETETKTCTARENPFSVSGEALTDMRAHFRESTVPSSGLITDVILSTGDLISGTHISEGQKEPVAVSATSDDYQVAGVIVSEGTPDGVTQQPELTIKKGTEYVVSMILVPAEGKTFGSSGDAVPDVKVNGKSSEHLRPSDRDSLVVFCTLTGIEEPAPIPDPTPSPQPSPDPGPSPEPGGDPTPSPDPEPAPAPEPDPTPEPSPAPGDEVVDGQFVTFGGSTYQIISAKYKTVSFVKAKNKKSVEVPASITIGGESYKVIRINSKAFRAKKIRSVTVGKNVKTIKAYAFRGSKATKLTIRTKKLTKKSVKGSLKASKIKKIRVKVGKKKLNSKYVGKYRKIFTKKNAGRKIKVSA